MFHSDLLVCLVWLFFLSNNPYCSTVVIQPLMLIWRLWLQIVLLIIRQGIQLQRWWCSIKVLVCMWKKMPIVGTLFTSAIVTMTKGITSRCLEWGGKLMSSSPDIFPVESLKAWNEGSWVPTELVKSADEFFVVQQDVNTLLILELISFKDLYIEHSLTLQGL